MNKICLYTGYPPHISSGRCLSAVGGAGQLPTAQHAADVRSEP